MSDYRYDPFQNSLQAVSVTNEVHIIPNSSPFTIRLREVPYKANPSTLTMRVMDFLVAAITDTQNYVTVTNPDSHSADEVLTVDSEKLQVTAKSSSSVATTLSAAITSTTATTCTVTTGSEFLVGNVIKIDNEQLFVTAVSGSTLTVKRGHNGTIATTHLNAAEIYILNNLTVTRGYDSTTATSHSIATPVYINSSMSEVATTPTAGQFWPDYSTSADGDDSWNTGTIQFNSVDAGKLVAVSYQKIGTLVDSLLPAEYPWHLRDLGDGSEGDFVSAGNVTLSGEHHYRNFVLNTNHTITIGDPGFLIIKCQNVCIVNGTINGNGVATNFDGTGGGAGGTSASKFKSVFVAATSGNTPTLPIQNAIISSGEIALGGCGVVDGGSGGYGGGYCQINSESVLFNGQINLNGLSSNGGGGGGVCVIAAKKYISDEGVVSVSGGITAGTSGGAGWYRKITLGG
ncbi:hypothetical protein [Sporomusa malonica]|uniref:Uncharacterized protein n=1 Tax=Sporomusa malonica TaxID=112901 RepID=A0A1W2ASD6_9FIRM|nr:hypothetical protein [Sporomusa malonica]SMC63118.1 hypothetical protein SAMN04488500_10656 [Sporomusa malonica]